MNILRVPLSFWYTQFCDGRYIRINTTGGNIAITACDYGYGVEGKIE